MSILRYILSFGAVLALLSVAPAIAADPARIDNTANLTFTTSTGRQTVPSNTVSLDVDRSKRPTSFSFRILPPDFKPAAPGCRATPSPLLLASALTADQLATAKPLPRIDLTQPLVIVIDNVGGNHDPLVRETTTIDTTNGSGTVQIQLTETAPDSGIFAGVLPPRDAQPMDTACYLPLKEGDTYTLSFAEDEYSLGSSASILIDPAGYVFDSTTGALVDGATVTLLDANNQPATVFGDDSVSRYPSTVISGQAVRDDSGRVYPASPGFYRFPFVAPGTYHLTIVPPANYSAPTTRDPAALALLRNAAGNPFIINAASFGKPFELVTPAPFNSDIPVDRENQGALLLTKVASVREASPGDFVQYRITVVNRDSVAVGNIHLSDTLPSALRYEVGSTRGAREPVVSRDSRTLDFTIPTLAPNGTTELRYVVMIKPNAPTGEAINRVVAAGGGITSNEADAAVRVKSLLFTDGFTLIGRITEGGCNDPASGRKGVPGIRVLLEDGTYVATDRDGLYHIEGIRTGRHVVQLDTASIPATLEPIACDADTRQAGSGISRFVESDGGLLKRVDFQLRPTGKKASADDTLLTPVLTDAEAAGNRDWTADSTPGVAMLFPAVGHNPRAPVLRVVIKHLPGQRVALTINGKLSDPLLFDTTDTNAAQGIAISRWSGLPLVDGDNTIEARVLDKDGGLVTTLNRVVHSSTAATLATVVPSAGRLVADGLTRPLVAIRITDRDGKPVRAGTLVPFHVDQPYTAAIEAELEQNRQLAGRGKAETTARVVGDDGIAYIALQPTTQAGSVHAVVTLTEEKTVRTSEIRAWLSASVKDWMVVGFGAGTLGYDTLHRHASGLPREDRNGVVTDGQLSFYAKGRIKGKWLATIAYDSNRKYDRDRGLLGTIDPDKYYTVYGDGSRQGYDAATARKIYVRIERQQFYAMFGDYETGMTETQLARYSRTLNGGKFAYEARRVSVAGFAANTDQLYARDEIQGNGLSGPYRLSGRDIVPNTDQVRLETRDRFRSELIVSSTQMTRHIDYDIDTAMGTIRFRQPVLTRDNSQNPVFIVVDYETYGVGNKLVAGGRAAVRLAKGKVEVGASAIHDETIGNATLVAADVKARLSKQTEVRGEVATGGRFGIKSGQAWLAEVEHHDKRIDLTAYARQQDMQFGVGQQNVVEGGTRKFGFDSRVRLSEKLSITATGWHQDNLEDPGSRDAADVRLELRRATGTVFVGAQLAMDRGIDGKDRDSRLLTLGGTQALFGNKLTLSGQTQFAPGGDKDSVDFPIRHQITAGYRITPGIRVIAGYEIADGADFTAHTAQVGFDVAPWTGAKLMSTVNQQAIGENGQRTFAQYGLNQSLPLGKHWTVDATLDASSTVRGSIPKGAVVNAFQPIASGGSTSPGDQTNGDYTAVTMGANYRAGLWSANGRVEYRDGTDNTRWGVTGNVLRSLGKGSTLASGVHYSQIRQTTGDVASYLTADVSLALRPLDSRWSMLERLEFRNEKADAGITDTNVIGVPAYGSGNQTTMRAINNLSLNYRSGAEGDGHGFEATVYYGAKWVRGAYADDAYTGFIHVVGFDLRKDLGRRFDVGVQASVQHAVDRGAVAYSAGPSVGVSPAGNVWISAGYNVSGYHDRDFEEDRYTRAGPYVTMRLKFDQRSIRRALLGRR